MPFSMRAYLFPSLGFAVMQKMRLVDTHKKLGKYLRVKPEDDKPAFEPVAITYRGYVKGVVIPVGLYEKLKELIPLEE